MSTGPLVDRVVAATGGARLVRARPGIGWLAVEVIPAFIWTQITGAISLEFFYFVAFLTALGATESQLVWLPAAVSAAGVAQAFVVLRRRPENAQHRCVRDTLIGRVLWLGTVLWPLLSWWQGWPIVVGISGAFAFVFLGQLVHMSGIANFITWTQALVPRELRGNFFAWRNVVSYVVVACVLFGLGAILPRSAVTSGDQILPLAILLLVATSIGIFAVWPLALAPGLDHELHSRPRSSLRNTLWQRVPYRRFLAWSLGISIAAALAPAMQPRLYLAAGVSTADMARYQSLGFYPAMIVGILLAARLLPRWQGRITLMFAHMLWLIGDCSLLFMNHDNVVWVAPLSQVLLGLGKGMWSVAWISRLQEVIPPGDPRWTALTLGIGSAAGLAGCLCIGPLTPAIEHALVNSTISVAWVLVAAGCGFRLIVTPLLALRDPPENPA
jgi:hypothetical protein